MLNLLVTIDRNYLSPLRTMLGSLFRNNPGTRYRIFLLHSDLSDAELASLNAFAGADGHLFEPIHVREETFADAPVLLHYTRAMYYRLLAYRLLPPEIERILYLDPDILVINPLDALYATDMGDNLYAAAYHRLVPAVELNRLRLYPYEIESYYNSGVLLLNLAEQRKTVDENEIFAFVEKNRAKLIMPDQDILNALYARRISTLDELRYNYDVRYYRYYRLATNGECDMEYVMRNTSILHFCGKRKPWNPGYIGQFHSLYRHYERLAGR